MDAWENLSPEERKGRADNQDNVSNEELLVLFVYVTDSEWRAENTLVELKTVSCGGQNKDKTKRNVMRNWNERY